MPNYGDAALRLPHDWSRASLASGQEFMAFAVGHENGKADAFLTGDPDKEHQFQFCEPKDVDRLYHLKSRHYDFCKSDKWTKNDLLWEWSPENFIEWKGQRLMARDAAYFHAEEKENKRKEEEAAEMRRQRRSRRDENDDYAARVLGAQGAQVFDENNRELRPQKRAGR